MLAVIYPLMIEWTLLAASLDRFISNLRGVKFTLFSTAFFFNPTLKAHSVDPVASVLLMVSDIDGI